MYTYMFFHAPKIQMVAYYKYWKSSKGKNKQYIVLAFLQNKIRNWKEKKAGRQSLGKERYKGKWVNAKYSKTWFALVLVLFFGKFFSVY